MPWELAQLNIATLRAPLDSPVLADFVANLDRINELADQSPGFVWRMQSDSADAGIAELVFGMEVIVNLSVWKSVDELHDYVYRSAHAEIMSRRKEWFEHMSSAYSVLWWVPEGYRPTPADARSKLDLFKSIGPSQDAFSFKICYPKPA